MNAGASLNLNAPPSSGCSKASRTRNDVLVDVWVMRYRGARLARKVIREAAPVRGHLSLWSYDDRKAARVVRVATLATGIYPSDKKLLPNLYFARVNKLLDAKLVIVGFEEFEYPKRIVDRFAQAWFCQLVHREGA